MNYRKYPATILTKTYKESVQASFISKGSRWLRFSHATKEDCSKAHSAVKRSLADSLPMVYHSVKARKAGRSEVDE